MIWTFNQHNFAGGRLDKELMGRQDLTQYYKGCTELRNFSIRRQGNLAKRRGTNLAADLSALSIDKYRLIPLVYSRDEGFYLLLSGGRIYLASRDGILGTDGQFSSRATDPYWIESGVSDERIDGIDFCQTGDTIFFVHHELPPFKVEFFRHAVTKGGVEHAALSLCRSDISFAATTHTAPSFYGVTANSMSGGTGSKKVFSYVVTYVGSDGVESFPSSKKSVSFNLPWPDGGSYTIKVYDAKSQSTPARYNIYKNYGSGYGWIGSIEAENITASKSIDGKSYKNYGEFVDDYITPDLSLTPPDATNRKTFSEAGDYPSIVSLYQQRLILGCSDNDPFTFWMSCTGDIYNFSTHSTIREDDAITATLAATEQPEILHALLSKEMMLFSNSGEWTVSPVSGNTVSYKTISAKMQSAIGTARWTKPFIVGDEIIFLDASGERLLATRYNYASDGYESQELTVLSQWLFRDNAVVRMAYRNLPDSTIHCVMSDGSIAVMVYMKEHEVCAWTRMDLGGGYIAKDVACSKAMSRGSTDMMYLVQNKSTGKYELWSERDDLPVRSANAIADFVCMDRVVLRTIAAGESFAGMIAVDATDGTVLDGRGDSSARTVYIGHPFRSKYESIYPDTKQDGGESTQMEILNATETKVRTIDSSTFRVGACAAQEAGDKTVQISPTCSGGKVSLPDRDARVVLSGTNAKDGRIRITHDGVWPLNILSVSTTYQVEPANQNGGGNG